MTKRASAALRRVLILAAPAMVASLGLGAGAAATEPRIGDHSAVGDTIKPVLSLTARPYVPTVVTARAGGIIPDRRRVSEPEHRALKAAALARVRPRDVPPPAVELFGLGTRRPPAPTSVVQQRRRKSGYRFAFSIRNQKDFSGVDRLVGGNACVGDPIPQAPRCEVPDTHGAVGTDYYAEVVNSYLAIYDKATNARLVGQELWEFFGYGSGLLFDPRIVKDPHTGRWLVTAVALEESPTVQKFFLAVSKTIDVRGEFWFYEMDVNITGDEFFDFPQLGVSTDTVMVTGNTFQRLSPTERGAARHAEMFAFPKSAVYHGSMVATPVFTGLPRYTAPPIVLDSSPTPHFVSAPLRGSALALYVGSNLATPSAATLTRKPDIPVSPYDAPADAEDCVSQNFLAVGTSEFVNASTQAGSSLWQVHSTAFGADNTIPTPHWYEINTNTSSLFQEGYVYKAPTSRDFNASIAANAAGDAVITWTALDPDSTTMNGCPEVMVTGREAIDGPGIMGPIRSIERSVTGYDPTPAPGSDPMSDFNTEKWGDYSSVAFDPSAYGACPANKTVWVVNEYVPTADDDNWGSRIGKLTFC
jgi:hypothetical protein